MGRDDVQVGPLTFVKVDAGTTYVGDDRGGWIHANQRPRHEVRVPEFFVLETPLSAADVAQLSNQDSPANQAPHEGVDAALLQQVCAALRAHLPDHLEVRPPSLAEWKRAREAGALNPLPGVLEILADAPFSNHRGAPMDGRPRERSAHGPLMDQLACIEVHPHKTAATATSSVPMDRRLPGTVLRLVLSPVREGAPRTVPRQADRSANLRVEVMCTLLIGVVPSFLIPVLRGFGGYALEGWANLLFGGLVAGFVTGAIWRPRRPTVTWEDGAVHEDDEARKVSQ
jgi:hypothetical protein